MPIWASVKNDIPLPTDNPVRIRVVAEQFAWNFHYPGADGKFGRVEPKFIDSRRRMGYDEPAMNSPHSDAGGDSARYQRVPHVVALILAVALLPLIVVGASVTSKGAGMAFPDRPTSNGALVNPPGWWQGEKRLWEHGHRLLGWTVGMLAIVSAACSWRRGATLRTLACATLQAIMIQGVLGGLWVREVSTPLAMIHGIWG